MNLHSIVRAAVNGVNPDIAAVLLASTSNSINNAGVQTPSYAAPVTVQVQVQPVSSQDLQHLDYLNLQGEFRALYLYGDSEGIVRVSQKGGDIFQFSPFIGQPVARWLVVKADETWNVDGGGFSRVIVQLQTDAPI